MTELILFIISAVYDMGFLSDILQQTFLQYAVLAALLSGVAAGITGTFVHIKRIGVITGGMAHAILGGVGAAQFFGIDPFVGAVITALFFSVVLTVITVKFGQAEDAVLSALWAAGMAGGIMFLHFTPGYTTDLMTYLFGNILMVTKADLIRLAVLDGIVIFLSLLFYRQLRAICFDNEYPLLRGISVLLLYGVFYAMISLTVVVLMQVVGLLLVIAILTLPAAFSALFFRTVPMIMLSAGVSAVLLMLAGIWVSWVTDSPAGAVIILLTTALYGSTLIVKRTVFRKTV